MSTISDNISDLLTDMTNLCRQIEKQEDTKQLLKQVQQEIKNVFLSYNETFLRLNSGEREISASNIQKLAPTIEALSEIILELEAPSSSLKKDKSYFSSLCKRIDSITDKTLPKISENFKIEILKNLLINNKIQDAEKLIFHFKSSLREDAQYFIFKHLLNNQDFVTAFKWAKDHSKKEYLKECAIDFFETHKYDKDKQAEFIRSMIDAGVKFKDWRFVPDNLSDFMYLIIVSGIDLKEIRDVYNADDYNEKFIDSMVSFYSGIKEKAIEQLKEEKKNEHLLKLKESGKLTKDILPIIADFSFELDPKEILERCDKLILDESLKASSFMSTPFNFE